VREETGVEVEIVKNIGEYHENGVQDGIEYDYDPACFLVKPIGGKNKRQEREVECIKLFNLKEMHASMVHDYILMVSARKKLN